MSHKGTQFIHRFWAGKPMPEDYEVFGYMWAELNPDWEVLHWTEHHVHDYPDLREIIDDLYERDAGRHSTELYVQLADVMGYAIVERWGGVYVNCDMQPVQPLSAEILESTAWASYENHEDGRIVNAAIGSSVPHDPFWAGLLAGLPERYWQYRLDEMIMSTGPAYLTDYANAHRDQITVFPVETFNPVHWKQVQQGGDASAWVEGTDWRGTATFAVHHWGHKRDGRTNTIEHAR